MQLLRGVSLTRIGRVALTFGGRELAPVRRHMQQLWIRRNSVPGGDGEPTANNQDKDRTSTVVASILRLDELDANASFHSRLGGISAQQTHSIRSFSFKERLG